MLHLDAAKAPYSVLTNLVTIIVVEFFKMTEEEAMSDLVIVALSLFAIISIK